MKYPLEKLRRNRQSAARADIGGRKHISSTDMEIAVTYAGNV